MTKSQYAWKSGFRHHGVDPETAVTELQRIRKKHGKATGSIIRDESRAKSAPLHPIIFHDTDKELANRARARIAAMIATHVTVIRVSIRDAGSATPRRVFVGIPCSPEDEGDDGERSREYDFVPVDVARANPHSRDAMLRDAISALRAFRDRFCDLAEVSGVLAEIDRLLDIVDAKERAEDNGKPQRPPPGPPARKKKPRGRRVSVAAKER